MNEKTARIAMTKAEQAGFVTRTLKGSGKGTGHAWRHYEYLLVIPENADTASIRKATGAGEITSPHENAAVKLPAAPNSSCGQFVPVVRAICPDGAGATPADLAFTKHLPSKEQRVRAKAGSLNSPVIPRADLSEREIEECHRHNIAALGATA